MSDPYNERFSVYVNDVQRYLKAAEQETCDQRPDDPHVG